MRKSFITKNTSTLKPTSIRCSTTITTKIISQISSIAIAMVSKILISKEAVTINLMAEMRMTCLQNLISKKDSLSKDPKGSPQI